MEATVKPFSPAYIAAQSGEIAVKPTAAEAFKAAQAMWLSGERVDMGALATALGISRPTLYKWCGQREQLLTDVIWSVTEAQWDHVVESTRRKRGVNRAVEVQQRFVTVVASAEPLHAYLRHETHAALRILTARDGFQARLVAKIAEFLRAETNRGHLQLRSDPDLIAYALVRLTEGLIYNDAIAAVEPRLEMAPEITRLLVT